MPFENWTTPLPFPSQQILLHPPTCVVVFNYCSNTNIYVNYVDFSSFDRYKDQENRAQKQDRKPAQAASDAAHTILASLACQTRSRVFLFHQTQIPQTVQLCRQEKCKERHLEAIDGVHVREGESFVTPDNSFNIIIVHQVANFNCLILVWRKRNNRNRPFTTKGK